MHRICIFPRVEGAGGVASFRLKFEAGLKARGIAATNDPGEASDAILVLAGTRNLIPLWNSKRRGVRVVQRLNGINWVQRRRNTGARHFVRAEYGNFILYFIRRFFADRIVYQSEFARTWWEDWYGKTRAPAFVIHNGVDLDMYSPGKRFAGPADPVYRLLVVEANLGGGYDMGLDHAVRLTETLAGKYNLPVRLVVVGRIAAAHRARVESESRVPIEWMGLVPGERIPEIDRSAHLLFSADLNAACPNAVIEALACGLPVVAFDTGALKELVTGNSGKLAPYGGSVWNLDQPDISSLAAAAAEILRDPLCFRQAARARAESALGVDRMVDDYLKVLLDER